MIIKLLAEPKASSDPVLNTQTVLNVAEVVFEVNNDVELILL